MKNSLSLLNIKLLASVGVVASSVFGCSRAVEEEKPPNIVFIMSDDHAFQAISAYGHPIGQVAPTPNIDRIAQNGAIFSNTFCGNSICGPSRAAILTGKHSHINGFTHNGVTFDGTKPTFPKMLQGAGYETAMIGKWHLSGEPTGFDYWNILDDQGSYYNPDFIKMGDTTRVTGYATDLITEYSINWLERRADKEQPFCLMVHHKAPHRNWMPALRHVNKYDGVKFPLPDTYFDDYSGRLAAAEQEMNIYRDMYEGHDLKMSVEKGSDSLRYNRWPGEFTRMNSEQDSIWKSSYRPDNDAFHEAAMSKLEVAEWKYQRYMHDYMGCIASVDEGVGKVLDYLEENGLADNTIVVYTSDQGFYLGEHGWFDKRFMYEPSFRMPLLISYPGHIEKGKVIDALTQNIDFAETFLDFAGVSVPEDMQGRSLRPMLEGEEPSDWRQSVYYHYYEYPGFHMVKRHYGIRTERYKLIHFYNDIDQWELYDLEKDPDEMNNLINDAAFDEKEASLRQKLDSLMRFYQVPPINQWKDEDIWAGH
ncbi:sulfatase [Marinilabilia sp.]|uniref:sulfatase family protein n=1 Tax=Marinilabilia sp. TaxID=2021252 RepID=UPI0025C5A36A|nr:sulfatase [Marinilabilia sp.]